MQVTPAQLSSLAQRLIDDERLAAYALACYTTHWDGDPDATEVSLTAVELGFSGLELVAGVRYSARVPGAAWVHRRLFLEDLAGVVGEDALSPEGLIDEDAGEE
jgi:hypothetical protein